MKVSFLLFISSIPLVTSRYRRNEIEHFWIDPQLIEEKLDEYDALWIKPHGCVWSECTVDELDEEYVGDYRDGDEQWYQYRTQEFCANSAYTLYGSKRGESMFAKSIVRGGCSKGHFINSFFTYGGADTLLKAVGVTPEVYFNNNNYNQRERRTEDYQYNYDQAADDYNYYEDNNNVCVEIEMEDEDNENGDRERRHNRKLSGSGDQNDGYSGALGCDPDGGYIIAGFDSGTCDGNFFDQELDSFDEYNDQHNSIGCHRIWSRRDPSNTYGLMYLFNNSWSCDTDLYPNGCPNPWGEKSRYEYALRVHGEGGNAQLAYNYLVWKKPARVMSWLFILVGTMVLLYAYAIKNRDRIKAKGGKFAGFARCASEDLHLLFLQTIALIKLGCSHLANKLRTRLEKAKKRVQKRKNKSKKRRSKSKSRTSSSRKNLAAEEPEEDAPVAAATSEPRKDSHDDYRNADDDDEPYDVRALASTSA